MNTSQWDLMPHQERALKFADKRKFSLLNYWVGTGKTLIGARLLEAAKNPVLIRMTSHKDQWASFFDNEERTFSHALTAKSAKERFLKIRDCDLLVVDEAHKFKSLKAKSTNILLSFLDKNPRAKVVFMTGTPVTASLQDFASYFCIASHLNEDIPLIKSEWDFNTMFLEMTIRKLYARGKRIVVREFNSFKKQSRPLFLEYLRSFMVTQSGEVLDLPDKVYHTRRVKKSGDIDLYKTYTSFLDRRPKETDKDPTLDLRLGKLKADIEKKVYREFSKVIVLSKFVPTTEKLALDQDFFPVPIHGGTKDREKLIEDFKRSEYKFLVGTYKTLGVGFNLQFTNALVLVDTPYTPSDLAQGLGRISRKGQDKLCHFFSYLYSELDKNTVRKLFKRDISFKGAGVRYINDFLDSL